MRKAIQWLAIATIGTSVQGALIKYTFNDADMYAAETQGMSDAVVSSISYTQGSAYSGNGDSTVGRESNVANDNFFAISSFDVGPDSSAYDNTQSYFSFAVTAGSGALDFSSSTCSMDLTAIRDDLGSGYAVTAYLFYNKNSTGWSAVGSQQRVASGGTTRIHAMNSDLYDASTDFHLAQYGLDAGAEVTEGVRTLSLSELGTLSSGDSIEFAVFVYDSRNNASTYYAGIDDIGIDGLTVIPEPTTLGLFSISSIGLVVLRHFHMK